MSRACRISCIGVFALFFLNAPTKYIIAPFLKNTKRYCLIMSSQIGPSSCFVRIDVKSPSRIIIIFAATFA